MELAQNGSIEICQYENHEIIYASSYEKKSTVYPFMLILSLPLKLRTIYLEYANASLVIGLLNIRSRC